MIQQLLCLWIFLIGLEVCSESGVPCPLIFQHLLQISSHLVIPCHHLLILFMHLKTNHSRLFFMHPEVIKSPTTLTGRNIAGVKIQFHLILTISKLHSCLIVPFVDIFVYILDCLYRGDAFHIDVAMVLPDQPSAVWYNLAIINHMSTMLIWCSSITVTKNGVGIFIDNCLLTKGLWK